MKKEMMIALTEVKHVLDNLDDNDNLKKIPNEFMEYLENNMDKGYKVKYIKGIDISKQPISNEAKEILKLIYRDFIASKEERMIILNNENKILEKIEKKKGNNY